MDIKSRRRCASPFNTHYRWKAHDARDEVEDEDVPIQICVPLPSEVSLPSQSTLSLRRSLRAWV